MEASCVAPVGFGGVWHYRRNCSLVVCPQYSPDGVPFRRHPGCGLAPTASRRAASPDYRGALAECGRLHFFLAHLVWGMELSTSASLDLSSVRSPGVARDLRARARLGQAYSR